MARAEEGILDFEKVFGPRADAESINRGLEDRRAHLVGRARHHVNLIGWALMVNSLSAESTRRWPADPSR